MNKLQKNLKSVLQKLGTLQVQKLIMTSLKVGKIFFSYPCLGFLPEKKNLGFTPCKTEQPLRGMELQEKLAQKG